MKMTKSFKDLFESENVEDKHASGLTVDKLMSLFGAYAVLHYFPNGIYIHCLYRSLSRIPAKEMNLLHRFGSSKYYIESSETYTKDNNKYAKFYLKEAK